MGAGSAYLASPPPPTPPPRKQTPRPPRPAPKNRAHPPQPAAVPAASRSDTIAEDLRRAHPFIRTTRSAAGGLRPALDGRLVVGSRPGVVRMVVSRDRLHRALVLAHSLIAGATRRAWSIEPYSKDRYGEHPGVAIAIGEHHYPMEVHEETRTLPFTQEEIEAWRNEYSWIKDRAHKMPPPQRKRKEPTGTLRVVLPNGYGGGRASWTDSPRSLNGSLSDVFRSLEERAVADDLVAENARRRREEFEREQRLHAERARLARIEEARATRAVAEINAWRQARALTDYAATLRQRLPELADVERARIETWCQWLEDRARRSDPTSETSLIAGFNDEQDARGW